MKKNMVWQNCDLRIEDYEEIFQEEQITDNYQKYQIADEFNNDLFWMEKTNLNIDSSDFIIKVGTIERWDGVYCFCKTINSSNISDCLAFEKDCVYTEFFVDSYGRFKSRHSHHDGDVSLEYRALKHDLTGDQKNHFLNMIECRKISSRTLRRYTESIGKYVAGVYGWKVRE